MKTAGPKRSITGKNRRRPDLNEVRENALRPSHYLGYDHDRLGMHLVSREAYEIAIRCFRRAIWLNPFESVFKIHLALCLYKLGRYFEALELISTQCKKDDKNTQMLTDLIEHEINKK